LQSLLPLFIQGVSEYELINILKKPPHCVFIEKALQDSLVLFQTHFLLFHTLYRLRSEWRSQGVGELSIITTCIKLNASPITRSNTLETLEPLAQYYLDWQNLSTTGQDDVDELLNRFWQQMAGHQPPIAHNTGALIDAYKTLEFEIDVNANTTHSDITQVSISDVETLSLVELKAQYRKLQHRYHPDKGGCAQKAQAILSAYDILFNYLKTAE
jgi:hypothetical protein